MQYDLEDRTKAFSKSVMEAMKEFFRNDINRPLISQLVRSATSVGANYREANGAISRKDFKNIIYICRKEIKETEYWIELLADSNPGKKDKLRGLWKEANELKLIFNKICWSLNKKP